MQAQNNHPLSKPSQPNHPLTSPKKVNPKRPKHEEYKVYNARWIMLFYMSLLNLLSDWTCYSVAPIALLTKQAFGEVDPESLVTVFLGANAIASAMEPAILGRLGLRRTVVFGSMLLMLGSIVKSGGVWDLLTGLTARRTEDAVEDSSDETWRLYLGFFLVGLSQPLYQCTPALLSASWFPENERTMATGVALNSNQLGIGCAFVFGTILVESEEDIIPYFGLLSVVATITFIGAALQFDDAPPTPPSDTARVIKGDLVINIPRISFSLRGLSIVGSGDDQNNNEKKKDTVAQAPSPACGEESTELTTHLIQTMEREFNAAAPSPAPTDEPVASSSSKRRSKKEKIEKGNESEQTEYNQRPPLPYYDPSVGAMGQNPMPDPLHAQQCPPQQYSPQPYPYMMPPNYYYPPPPAYYQHHGPQYSELHPGFYHGYDEYGQYHNALLENSGYDDYAAEDFDGIEPIMTQLDHKLDIDIRDDQLIQQVKACFARPGFSHCIVAFTTSGMRPTFFQTHNFYILSSLGCNHFVLFNTLRNHYKYTLDIHGLFGYLRRCWERICRYCRRNFSTAHYGCKFSVRWLDGCK
jgi:hypothetical protein